jgi:hypothetical protein
VKTSKLFLVTILTSTTIVAAAKLSSVLLTAQKSGPSASDESALLKGFAAIQPIDVHIHIYKDDPELNGLIERLNLRAVNICVIDDRDPLQSLGRHPEFFFRSSIPRSPVPLSTFTRHLTMPGARLEVKMDHYSFLAGLFRPLLHVGLSRRFRLLKFYNRAA